MFQQQTLKGMDPSMGPLNHGDRASQIEEIAGIVERHQAIPNAYRWFIDRGGARYDALGALMVDRVGRAEAVERLADKNPNVTNLQYIRRIIHDTGFDLEMSVTWSGERWSLSDLLAYFTDDLDMNKSDIVRELRIAVVAE